VTRVESESLKVVTRVESSHWLESRHHCHDLTLRRRQARWKHHQEAIYCYALKMITVVIETFARCQLYHQEGSRSQGKQPITEDSDKKWPIRHTERWGVNETLRKYSAINTAESGPKTQIFDLSSCWHDGTSN